MGPEPVFLPHLSGPALFRNRGHGQEGIIVAIVLLDQVCS
jgi:hypothetical protein